MTPSGLITLLSNVNAILEGRKRVKIENWNGDKTILVEDNR